MSSDASAAQKELRALSDKIDSANRSLNDVLSAINRTKEEHKNMVHELAALTNRKQQLELTLADYESIKRIKEERLNSLHETKKDLEADVERLTASMQELDATYDAETKRRTSAMLAALNELTVTLNNQKAEEQVHRDAIVQLEKQLNALRAEHKTVSATIQETRATAEKTRTALGDLGRAYSDAEGRLRVLARDEEQLVKTIQALSREKLEATKERDAMQARVGELTNEVAEKTRTIKKLDSEITAKRAERDAAAAALIAMAERRETLDQREQYLRDRYQKAGIPWTD